MCYTSENGEAGGRGSPASYPGRLRGIIRAEGATLFFMNSVRDKLSNMFTKVMVGTVTREEGTMLINHLVKEDHEGTLKELSYLIENPPTSVFPKTILHTIALTRNKAFFNIMVSSLEHKNEEVSVFAAQELARLGTGEAKDVLVEHINSDIYHVRKASAAALAEIFGAEGAEILRKHISFHGEPFYRLTSALGLLMAGRRGVEALVEIVSTGSPDAVATAAEAISRSPAPIGDGDIPMIVEALLKAGDGKEVPAIIALLKAIGSFRGRAQRYSGYVLAFADYPFKEVRTEAEHAMSQLKS